MIVLPPQVLHLLSSVPPSSPPVLHRPSSVPPLLTPGSTSHLPGPPPLLHPGSPSHLLSPPLPPSMFHFCSTSDGRTNFKIGWPRLLNTDMNGFNDFHGKGREQDQGHEPVRAGHFLFLKYAASPDVTSTTNVMIAPGNGRMPPPSSSSSSPSPPILRVKLLLSAKPVFTPSLVTILIR